MFYTQSININNLIHVGFNQTKASNPEALSAETMEPVPVMTDVLDYDGEGSTIGDGTRIAFEQVILYDVYFKH